MVQYVHPTIIYLVASNYRPRKGTVWRWTSVLPRQLFLLHSVLFAKTFKKLSPSLRYICTQLQGIMGPIKAFIVASECFIRKLYAMGRLHCWCPTVSIFVSTSQLYLHPNLHRPFRWTADCSKSRFFQRDFVSFYFIVPPLLCG